MKHIPNFILLLAILFTKPAVSQMAQQDCPDKFKQVKENPYSASNTTKLKGGYEIKYGFNCNDQYLLFLKGGRLIDTLSVTTFGSPYALLGYVFADYGRYFVFVMINGAGQPGNPVAVEVREKATAKNIVPVTSSLIDVSKDSRLVFYYESDIPEYGDDFVMLDLETLKRKNFPFPKNIFGEPGVCNRLKLKKVTATKLIFGYEVNGIMRTKTYSR